MDLGEFSRLSQNLEQPGNVVWRRFWHDSVAEIKNKRLVPESFDELTDAII